MTSLETANLAILGIQLLRVFAAGCLQLPTTSERWGSRPKRLQRSHGRSLVAITDHSQKEVGVAADHCPLHCRCLRFF